MDNTNIFITNSSEQTRKMGEILAKEMKGGEVVCLSGELGSGKTTFAQGLLKGLGAKGPYTSPTFVVMKEYKLNQSSVKTKFGFSLPTASQSEFLKAKLSNSSKPSFIKNIYHIDAYRVSTKDVLDLGWEEIIAGKNNIVIVEWAERTKSIIPKKAIWLKFKHLEDNKRKISIK